MEKIETKFICLSEPAFFELIDTLYERLQGKNKEKWLNSDQVMSLLNIASPTTLQKLRDSGALRISQLSKKLILYDRDSVDEYLEKHTRKRA